jgi:hypothetical protein
MKFSEIVSLAQSGDLQIGAVGLKRMEILWAGSQRVSVYVLNNKGLWAFKGAA